MMKIDRRNSFYTAIWRVYGFGLAKSTAVAKFKYMSSENRARTNAFFFQRDKKTF